MREDEAQLPLVVDARVDGDQPRASPAATRAENPAVRKLMADDEDVKSILDETT